LVKHCIVFRPLSIVDSGIRKIARVFDKGLQSLQEKKDKLMEKSAAIREKRDAIYGKATAITNCRRKKSTGRTGTTVSSMPPTAALA